MISCGIFPAFQSSPLPVFPGGRTLLQERAHTFAHVFRFRELSDVNILRTVKGLLKIAARAFAERALGKREDRRTLRQEFIDAGIYGVGQARARHYFVN